jgi:hypothetical protein
MSDSPTQSGDLGPMPEPEIEPGETNPGGADAMPEDAANVPADLAPEDNPAVEVKAPDPDLEAAADSDSADNASERAEAEAGEPDEDPTQDQDEVEGPPGEAGAGEPGA